MAVFNLEFLMPLAVIYASGHWPKSQLFNPRISIAFSDEDFPPDLTERILENSSETERLKIKIKVVSDGRKAYLKFLE